MRSRIMTCPTVSNQFDLRVTFIQPACYSYSCLHHMSHTEGHILECNKEPNIISATGTAMLSKTNCGPTGHHHSK
jgi:hypothetical protein